MRRLVLILSFFIVFVSYSYSQSEHLPQVAWRTILKNVVMVNDSTYTVEVDPIDYNEPGAIQRIIGNYLKDFVGHTYKVIDSTSTTITVVDVFQTGVGPQTDRAAVVYRSVGDGLSPYLAPIYYNYLDKSAFDYSRSIELSVLWEVGAAYIKDSADILWWKDTLSHIATKYDLDTLSFEMDTISLDGYAKGLGDVNYVAKWINEDSLGSSLIYDTGTAIGINGITVPTQVLDVNGNARFRNIGTDASTIPLGVTSDGTFTTNVTITGGAVWMGGWNANTNTPTLSDATGTAGEWYKVIEYGVRDLGSGVDTFRVGDDVIHNGTIWEKYSTSITETDPIYSGSVASYITGADTLSWDQAYNNQVTGAAFSGTTTKTLTLTQQDGGTITANFTDNDTDTDTNTTYSQSAETVTGGAAIRLTGSDATNDDISVLGSGTVSVARTDASTITISGATNNDNSATNEGILGVGAGTASTSVITSNTSGANGVTITANTGISISETTSTNGGTITLTNSAPDQTVSLTGSGATSVTGTYPNFTISSTDNNTTSLPVKNSEGTTQFTATQSTGVRFVGSGATLVSFTPATQLVTISSTDNNTTYSAGTGLSLAGTTFNHSNSITAGTASEGGATRTLAFGGTFNIPSVNYDAQGHITGKGSVTLTMPANPNTDNQNLSLGTTTATTQPINITSGSGVTLTSATTSLAGLMSAADKTNLNNIPITYLPLSGGTMSGAFDMGLSAQSTIGAHVYSRLYDVSGNVYYHYYPSTHTGVSTRANLRVWNSTSNVYRELQFSGDGSFTWGGNIIYHSGNFTDNSTNWNTSYNDKINSAAFTGTTTKTLTLTQQDGGTVTANFTDLVNDADASVTNEGSLTVSAGTATTSTINSNTSGSTPVTVSVDGTNLGISESGNTITLSNLKPDQTVSLTGSGATSVTGTYPNFTVSSTNTTYTAGTGISASGTTFNLGLEELTTGTPSLNTHWIPWVNSANNLHYRVGLLDLQGIAGYNAGKLQGYAISATAPTTNQVMQWNGSAWTPTTLATATNYWTQASGALYPATITDEVRIGQNTDLGAYKLQVNAPSVFRLRLDNTSQDIDFITTGTGTQPYFKITHDGSGGLVLGTWGGFSFDSFMQISASSRTPQFPAGLILGTSFSTSTAGSMRWNGTNFQGYNGSVWVNLDAGGSTGMTDPMTSRGDLIYRNSSNVTARLGRGTAGQLLYSNGTDLSWRTPVKADIGLGNVENTALSTWTGSTNIGTVGSITQGNWGGDPISAVKGGTGKTSYTAYALLAGGTTSTGTLQQVAGVGTSGQVLTSNGAGALPTWQAAPAGGGSGTVTSVGLSMPSIFSVSGSPVTTSGTLTATLNSQTTNKVLASPNGSTGTPTFRALVSNDIPILPASKTTLSDTQVAVGNSSNQLSGSADLTYDDSWGKLSVWQGYGTVSLKTVDMAVNTSGPGVPVSGRANLYFDADKMLKMTTSDSITRPVTSYQEQQFIASLPGQGGVPMWATPGYTNGFYVFEVTASVMNYSGSANTYKYLVSVRFVAATIAYSRVTQLHKYENSSTAVLSSIEPISVVDNGTTFNINANFEWPAAISNTLLSMDVKQITYYPQ